MNRSPSNEQRDLDADSPPSTSKAKTNKFCEACNGSGLITVHHDGYGDYCVLSQQPCPRGCQRPASQEPNAERRQ